jgi:hypothetical protein
MRHDLGVHDPAIEHALDGDGFPFGHRIGVLAPTSKIDQRVATTVVKDELIAEDLGDLSLDGGSIAGVQILDSSRLKHHDALRPPTLCDPEPSGARGGADGKKGERDPCQHATVRHSETHGALGRWTLT